MVVLWIPGWWPRHQPGRPAGLLPSSPPRPGSYTRLLAGPARVAAPPPVPGQRPLALGQLVVECGQPRPATLRSAAPPPAAVSAITGFMLSFLELQTINRRSCTFMENASSPG